MFGEETIVLPFFGGYMTVENQDELKKRAAVMYYRDDMTQAQIARALYLSRTKISRLLKAAKEENIVDIRINGGFRRNDYLEHIFEERYGLKEAVILADIPDGEDEALRTVARAAAEYIDSILTKDSIIGIGRGRTLQTVVECMEPQRFLPIQVVQLIGLLNNPSQNEEEMELVRQFAKVYGASCHNLFAPFILDDKQARQVLNRVAAVGKTIELAKQANVILSSVGNFDLKDKRILWNSYLGKEEKLRLSQQGAVGLFFGRYYDREGRILDTELHNKIFGLEVEEIVNKEQVITIAQGQKKALPILGALHGGLMKTLITDENTALNVLIQEGKMIE